MDHPMTGHRRGLTHRFIALLTAAAMPLCCCIVEASGSCCEPIEATPIVETSCCSSQQCQTDQPQETTDESPCGDADCGCCLKAPVSSVDWTPPIDTIGTPLPPFSLADNSVANAETMGLNTNLWDEPPPKPGGVDSLRGHVILQV